MFDVFIGYLNISIA